MDNNDLFPVTFSDQTGGKLVGGYVPLPVADYLGLLALYHKTTVSNIIREMIQHRIDNEEPEELIINTLANRAYKEWFKRLKANSRKKDWKSNEDLIARFREFELEVKFRLLKRKVNEPKAIEIIQVLEEKFFSGGMIDAED